MKKKYNISKEHDTYLQRAIGVKRLPESGRK